MVGDRIRLASTSARRSAEHLRPAEWLVLAPFGVFCFVYPWAMLLMSFDWMPWGMEWMSSLLLGTLGLTAGAWLWLNYGARGAWLALGLFALGIALEYAGVTTGLPFGEYRYTGVLVPGLPGGVPLAIGFAWVLIVVGGLFTALAVFPRGLFTFRVCLLGATLAVGLDLLLEPVAFHVKRYWLWLGDPAGGYYGVPWSNFAAWFVAALAMNGFVAFMLRGNPRRWGWVPVALYVMNAFLFGVVNVAHGIWAPGAVALAVLGLLWLSRGRIRATIA